MGTFTRGKSRHGVAYALAILVLVATMAACKNPLLDAIEAEVETAVTPPVISAYYPAADASGIPSNAELSVTFSKKIDPDTVGSSSLQISDGTNPVGGRYSVQDTTITFIPTGGFSLGQTYTATITRNLMDTDGRALAEAFSWSFTTNLPADLEPPVLSSLSFESADILDIAGAA